ncbi:MAG: PspC domain-containing protein [candidate division Zixibacteria bacterium]|nr:PspC domain-containing protein [candidate division Zixibacteria bacterium]
MDKRLYRSRESRMIAGVCGGLGEYFDMDPTIVRLIVVAAALAAGGGLLAYILAWIIVPERPTGL